VRASFAILPDAGSHEIQMKNGMSLFGAIPFANRLRVIRDFSSATPELL
jgi:hypothetical protein